MLMLYPDHGLSSRHAVSVWGYGRLQLCIQRINSPSVSMLNEVGMCRHVHDVQTGGKLFEIIPGTSGTI